MYKYAEQELTRDSKIISKKNVQGNIKVSKINNKNIQKIKNKKQNK